VVEIKDRQGPLANVRVVDLTSMIFGPYATQIMADMGADVIKVEPLSGDDTRNISVGRTPGMGGVYVNVNRGKRSISLDLKSDEGKAALTKLIAGADIFIHSMRAKAIQRLGFDYPAVCAINPNIVYTNCYGYGRRGPDADKPAYDDTIQAECGIPHVQQLMTGSPDFAATIMADKVSGLTALYATMMALFHRERTGEGQEVEVGMFEAMASFMLVEHGNGKIFNPPLGPAHYPRVVGRNRKPYRTKDGYVAALIYNDRHWKAFVEAVKPDWVTDNMARLQDRAQQIDHIYVKLAETFLERTTAEWISLLEELNVPVAPLRTTDELFDNEHLNAVGFFEDVESKDGPLRMPGVPIWFSKSPGKIAGPTATLGEHTDEVLAELGLS
jgi:crotonobetainyl-CoA:carnitine CoA-transferase CaiB-like acyl-CoA transferase